MRGFLRKAALASAAVLVGSSLTWSSALTAAAATNIPGGTLDSCAGTKKYDKTQTDGSGSMRLRIYYSSAHGGRNCATAYKGGSVAGKKSYIRVSMHFSSYDGVNWPKYATDGSENYTTYAGAIYLDNADGKCIDVDAIYEPAGGGPESTIAKYNFLCG